MTDLPSARDLAATPTPGGGTSSTTRLAVSAVVGLVAGVAVGLPAKWPLGILAGWIAGGLTYELWLWLTIRGMDAGQTASHAVREDPGRAMTDVAVLLSAVASLLAVGLVVAGSSSTHGLDKAVHVAASVVGVVVGWALVHLSYTTRYARLYYTGVDGGIDFQEEDPPQYMDFAYVAFTIGMTFQVSDTDLQTKEIRSTALHHALLAYLFGAVIVASTINVLAGLAK
ncbi:MAG: hypothetical protein QOG52_1698 [Frankiaceae bacterium]|jgi:uncharacterized membrane protein|nr:hypothetical protein [Frankiaceae bacterium]